MSQDTPISPNAPNAARTALAYTPHHRLVPGDEFVRLAGYCILLSSLPHGRRERGRWYGPVAGREMCLPISRAVRLGDGSMDVTQVDQ